MKPRYNTMSRLGLIALLLVVSLVLTVGTAWGRYRTELEPFEYWFIPRGYQSVYLWGSKGSDGYEELPGSWTVENSGSSMPFLVTNGEGDDFADRDLVITIQLAATEGILDAGNLNVQLAVVDGESEPTYNAVAEQIKAGTVFYDEFGGGWLYRFYDEAGKELTWTLKGGQLSEFSGELFLAGNIDPALCSLLQLQVVAVNAA